LSRKHNIGFRCALGTCDLSSENVAAFTDHADEALANCEVAV
jgi:hypothetical protein